MWSQASVDSRMSLDDDFSAFLTEIESLPETVETKGQNSPDYSATQEQSNKKKTQAE